METKAKIGIMGAAGFTGGELIRLLLNHPNITLVSLQSRSQAGKKISAVHPDLLGEIDLVFTENLESNLDIIFVCLPHGESKYVVNNQQFGTNTKIIDLSNDFRLQSNASNFIYGLPELNKSKIKGAKNIANPGCFATAIQLALLPMAHAQKLNNDIHISAITGSTGAGIKGEPTVHFSWRTNNISVYKAFNHQHLGEINESLLQLQPTLSSEINFIPYRGNFTRGIIATTYTIFEGCIEYIKDLYKTFYKDQPFVFISDINIDLKQVINTNKCIIYLEKQGNKLLIISIIDNLIKGASGQAIQNMNLMMGWEESTGLHLKSIGY